VASRGCLFLLDRGHCFHVREPLGVEGLRRLLAFAISASRWVSAKPSTPMSSKERVTLGSHRPMSFNTGTIRMKRNPVGAENLIQAFDLDPSPLIAFTSLWEEAGVKEPADGSNQDSP
jgi:hypothetical protein